MPQIFEPAVIPFPGAGQNRDPAKADVVVFGAPHGTPYRQVDNTPYASAPDALRTALQEDALWVDHWDFDLGGPLLGDGRMTVADAGNLKTSPLAGQANRDLIRQAGEAVIGAGGVPIMLGGDDSTPIPFIEALAPLGPLSIVQIDAHIDWRQERHGEPLGFSSTMRRASEMAHVEQIVQVGMRGVGSARRQEVEEAERWGATLITARAFHRQGIERVLPHLPEGGNCMITLDCDGLDPSFMPAVMAPTPGGLSYVQALDLIEAVIGHMRLVAFDLVEFVPGRDRDGIAAITAGRIVANALGQLARR